MSVTGTDVFISYKREERADVERIAERLRGLGLNVWFDTKLASGVSFDEEINREVRGAKCVLVCWSPGAMASDWVRAEASIGRGRGVLAAVTLRPTDLYPPFNLIHTEDLTTWQGEDLHPGWLNILARIGELTERPDIVQRARRYVAASAGPALSAAPSAAGEQASPPPATPDRQRPGAALWAALGAVALVVIGGGLWASGMVSPSRQTAASACPARVDLGSSAPQVRLDALRRDHIAAARADASCLTPIETDLAAIERLMWTQAQNEKTPAAVQTFLDQFPANATPTPQFRKEAEALLAQLQGPVNQQVADASCPERPAFNHDLPLDGLQGLRAERAQALDAKREACVAIIDRELKTVEARIWAAAQRGGNPEALRRYLEAFPPGAVPAPSHRRDAEQLLQRLEPVVAPPRANGEAAAQRQMGVWTVQQRYAQDMDRDGQVDFWLRNGLIHALNGTRFSPVGATAPSLSQCQAATYAESAYDVGKQAGAWVCALTESKVFAAFTVQQTPEPQGPVRVNYMVWSPR